MASITNTSHAFLKEKLKSLQDLGEKLKNEERALTEERINAEKEFQANYKTALYDNPRTQIARRISTTADRNTLLGLLEEESKLRTVNPENEAVALWVNRIIGIDTTIKKTVQSIEFLENEKDRISKKIDQNNKISEDLANQFEIVERPDSPFEMIEKPNTSH